MELVVSCKTGFQKLHEDLYSLWENKVPQSQQFGLSFYGLEYASQIKLLKLEDSIEIAVVQDFLILERSFST